jgi:hypothetical protein
MFHDQVIPGKSLSQVTNWVLKRELPTMYRALRRLLDPLWETREKVMRSKYNVAFVWQLEQQIPQEKSSDVRQISNAPITHAYAEYLGLHLIELHKIADPIQSQQNVASDIKGFIVFQIRTLALHPFARHDQCMALAPFLDYKDQDIADAAKDALRKLSETRTHTIIVKAQIDWFDNNLIVARFEHPSFGVVEREFERSALPLGAELGDRFELVIEHDASGRVFGYHPLRNALEKGLPMEWEKIPKPAAPKNLNDLAEMARYDEAMDRYMAQTTEMRARDAQRWRTTQKKR